jgi:hypothetical protein
MIFDMYWSLPLLSTRSEDKKWSKLNRGKRSINEINFTFFVNALLTQHHKLAYERNILAWQGDLNILY